MAIVNRTPDSFFDKGATYADDAAREAVRSAIAAGADIIDVGGVKAGPGSEVDVEEETRRTVPFLAAVREEFPDTVLSIDTWRAEVARRCADAGVDIINDTWAGADPGLGDVAAEFSLGFVCSHTGGAVPRTRPHRVHYDDIVQDVIDQTTHAAEALVARGVPREGVLIDPTHDFGKNTWHGLELLRRVDEIVATGWPVLMALSNKDFIGETLGRPVDQRHEGTLAATAIAAAAGAAVFRAHDVAGTLRVLEMTASIRGDRPPTRVVRGLV
ncbi:dihydropteroate synthase [Aeromicrobium chenweiae]|uniref:Inactive dihydropteroate synthase 2 n=2 Tax=Aeromicrobium chenweiae TaxID=2079793 RepID=A0A2S0WRX5_9ACTN|nr:dihydropteroate synthase [Aeromicrobium chenweiae]TGN33042.1 dihydropteroate synthase [Aeromicrobium chenweiae]